MIIIARKRQKKFEKFRKLISLFVKIFASQN